MTSVSKTLTVLLSFIASVDALILKSPDTVIDIVTLEHVSSDYGHRFKRSSEEHLPDHIHFRFTSRGSDVNLRLKRSVSNQESDIPVYVIRNNNIIKDDVPSIKNGASYLDKVMGAAMLVRKRIDGTFALSGTYYDATGRVHIHPSSGQMHEIRESKEVYYGNDFQPNADNTNTSLPEVTSTRSKRQSVSEYTVEVLMCADYKDYSHWEKQFKNNKTLAKSEMRLYYSFIAQSMSLRYDSVTDVDPRLKISILITGLLILDHPDKSRWTENEATVYGTVEVKPVIKSFKNWVRTHHNDLPPSDHWMLFSGYDLTSSGSTVVAGYATLAAMCTQSSVSLIEQDYSASVGATAAHELGHSLSALHDGDREARRCPDTDNFIMSTKLVNPSDNITASRPWEFSQCSVEAFRKYLSRVYCTRKTGKTISTISTQLDAGQVYSSDVQCKLAMGNESYFGRGIQYDKGFDSMCRAMYCAIPGRPRYFQKIFPMEKTSCGDRKWCIKGRCVEAPEAPRTPDNCPQGDDPSENCRLDDCPFFTKKGKISYCCNTCGVAPHVTIQDFPRPKPKTKPTTRPSTASPLPDTTPLWRRRETTKVPDHRNEATTKQTSGSRDPFSPIKGRGTTESPRDVGSFTTSRSTFDSTTTGSGIFERFSPRVRGIFRNMFQQFRNLFSSGSTGTSGSKTASADVPQDVINWFTGDRPQSSNRRRVVITSRRQGGAGNGSAVNKNKDKRRGFLFSLPKRSRNDGTRNGGNVRTWTVTRHHVITTNQHPTNSDRNNRRGFLFSLSDRSRHTRPRAHSGTQSINTDRGTASPDGSRRRGIFSSMSHLVSSNSTQGTLDSPASGDNPRGKSTSRLPRLISRWSSRTFGSGPSGTGSSRTSGPGIHNVLSLLSSGDSMRSRLSGGPRSSRTTSVSLPASSGGRVVWVRRGNTLKSTTHTGAFRIPSRSITG